MSTLKQPFSYSIRKQKNLSLVVFNGQISIRDSQTLDSCLNEVRDSDSTFFIISFKNVPIIERNTHRFILSLKNLVIKDRDASFKVVGMVEQFRNELIDFGILKQADFAKNLSTAIEEYNLIEVKER